MQRNAWPGDRDVVAALDELAARLPDPLRDLAEIAFDYGWSWTQDGTATFSTIDPRRFERVNHNPVRLLRDTPATRLARLAADGVFVSRVRDLRARLLEARAHVEEHGALGTVAFMCSEFGVHRSLPCYSGGLGVLAGDILKEASDRALPFVGVGLMYRRGYFHQRLDLSGKQHEYWVEIDPDTLPCVLVTGDDGEPLTVSVPVHGERLVAQIWRVDVGRVPLYLLDADREENSVVARWTTSRLYEGNRAIRLAQYALLGVGGIRALRALGIEPSTVHLNEGHPALAALALAKRGDGTRSLDAALATVRDRLVFTTHTPVPAGNETYGSGELVDALGGLLDELGADRDEFLGLGRVQPADTREESGMTPFAIRTARSTNGVSELHGKVARAMWAPMFTGRAVEDVPITHVTNGVHLPTWMAPPMRRLLTRHLGPGWETRAADPATWAAVDQIPDAELWQVRTDLRHELVEFVRERSVRDRLARGEAIDYVAAAASTFDPNRLTVGFARRLATYKRLHLLSLEPARALRVLGDRLQFLFAGKAHPLDEEAKLVATRLFELKHQPGVGSHVAFIEDYDLSAAPALVAGCDVWLNLPRPPYEASGTSGMKAALNGGLNVSSLDGWWVEAYDGRNGWAVDGGDGPDGDEGRDRRDATALFDIVESQVEPLFYDRGRDGLPHDWIARVKATLRTIGPRFCATRMMEEYERRIYAAEPRRVGASQSSS
ncbi:MAG TPA: alpha-glucan family phosphorylase [Acidimicrobiia bacterium]|jgi:starch phosphorylase